MKKHGSGDAVPQNSESSLNYSSEMDLETLRDCENNTNTTEVYPKRKPFNNSITQHKRLNIFHLQSSTHHVAEGKSMESEQKRNDNDDNAGGNNLNCMKGDEEVSSIILNIQFSNKHWILVSAKLGLSV